MPHARANRRVGERRKETYRREPYLPRRIGKLRQEAPSLMRDQKSRGTNDRSVKVQSRSPTIAHDPSGRASVVLNLGQGKNLKTVFSDKRV